MVFQALKIGLKNLFNPATNPFPVARTPPSVYPVAAQVLAGTLAPPVPPVETPDGFRGAIAYDVDACTGCKSCIRVCSPLAIRFVPFSEEEQKAAKDKGQKGKGRVRFYLARCISCGECADICPTDCIEMTHGFLLADVDKWSDTLVINKRKE